MRCHEQQLYVKLSKCQFCVEEIPWLDEFVGRNGVRIHPDKVCVIKEWSMPRTKKQMERFWCFDEVKRRLSTPPVLQLPDFDKPFGIRMDASNFAIGGVLFQNEGGLEHPIAYTSRKMKLAELNYPV
ncbi:hypothetical protein PHMEG_00027849 [Phytophthora megakarya]|uniref:Reverse transcriptase/retrotransposon-derived protein RNase H-like domain-containing protein n=1 Tax=Phytophthora megakarya TaxID=4795 RepID=A0A225V7D2_9STRA|nr:hypothetical protein PHMEG_00027849 [Phytophthora megakarya]